MKHVLLSAVASFFVAFAPFAAQADDATDRAAIESVVQDYFDGIGAADRTRLERAFAVEHAAMIGLRKEAGGALGSWKDMSAVVDQWVDQESPEGAGRDGEILDVSVVDGRIATVMFRYKDEYFDALTLLKVEGAWKIVAKAFVER